MKKRLDLRKFKQLVAAFLHEDCLIGVWKRQGKSRELYCSIRLSKHDVVTTPFFPTKDEAVANAKKVAEDWGPVMCSLSNR